MSRSRPDERDLYRDKHAPAPGVPVVSAAPSAPWHEQPTGVHSEPWLFTALKDIKVDINGIRAEQVEQGKTIAGVAGEVKQLSNFMPRPKSPSDGVTSALLAHQIKSGASWRKWAQRILGAVILGAIGWVGKLLVG